MSVSTVDYERSSLWNVGQINHRRYIICCHFVATNISLHDWKFKNKSMRHCKHSNHVSRGHSHTNKLSLLKFHLVHRFESYKIIHKKYKTIYINTTHTVCKLIAAKCTIPWNNPENIRFLLLRPETWFLRLFGGCARLLDFPEEHIFREAKNNWQPETWDHLQKKDTCLWHAVF